jgi:hypothetical protein
MNQFKSYRYLCFYTNGAFTINRLFTPTLTGNLNEQPIILKHCNLQNLNETFYNLLFMWLTQHIPKTTIENLGL